MVVLTDEVEMESYYHFFDHSELVELFAAALEGRAGTWEEDAKTEELKSAANQGKIGMLGWGAKQLRQLAEVFRRIPDGEIRERPIPVGPLVDLPGPTYDGPPELDDLGISPDPAGVDSPVVIHGVILEEESGAGGKERRGRKKRAADPMNSE